MKVSLRGCLFVILLLSKNIVCSAQDSLTVLTANDYYLQLSINHPIAKQANLLSEQARMELRMAKGAMDPSFLVKYYDKNLSGTDYYHVWDNELHVPVYFAKVIASYEKNGGVNLNGENYTPTNGLSSLGVYLPLGEGLITDARRTAIRQAEVMINGTEAERVKVINKLLLEGMKAYYDWAAAFYRLDVFKNSLELSEIRTEGIKERVKSGDLAAFDSIEAQAQLQTIYIQFKQAYLSYIQATLEASNYLWDEAGQPLMINERTIPDNFDLQLSSPYKDSLTQLLEYARVNHPEIIKMETKLSFLQYDRKLATNKLLPKVDVSMAILGKGFYLNDDVFSNNYIKENSKVGVNFYMPLRMRAETGKYKLMGVKVGQAEYELQQKRRETENQLLMYYNECIIVADQCTAQEQLTRNMQLLSEGEKERFDSGESTLFIVNSREQSYISAQLKLIEMKAKFAKSQVYLKWAAGKMD
jgi:outer membrane protein TolC